LNGVSLRLFFFICFSVCARVDITPLAADNIALFFFVPLFSLLNFARKTWQGRFSVAYQMIMAGGLLPLFFLAATVGALRYAQALLPRPFLLGLGVTGFFFPAIGGNGI